MQQDYTENPYGQGFGLDQGAFSVPPAHRAQLEGFIRLENLHKGLQAAQEMQETAIGRPICIEGCARCCIGNTPVAWGIELDYIHQWLLTHPDVARTVLRRAKQRLESPMIEAPRMGVRAAAVSRDPQLGPVPPLEQLGERTQEGLREDMNVACHETCPMLDPSTLQCSIWPVRPFPCRTYGVTHLAEDFCPRPPGIGESDSERVIVEGPAAQLLWTGMLNLLRATGGFPQYTQWEWLPAGIVRRLDPQWMEHNEGHIPTVRLLSGKHLPAALFEEQVRVANDHGMLPVATPEGVVSLKVLAASGATGMHADPEPEAQA